MLSCGYVKFYKNKKLSKLIECKNKTISKPVNFNCFLLDGKTIFLKIYLYIYYYIFIILDFWTIIKHFDKEEESFNNICRHGLNVNTNRESLLAVCLPNSMAKKLHFFSFPLIKEEKWIIGAKTKYDIPQFIEGIPDGFAIFCTTWEAGKVRKYQEQLAKKNKNKKNEKTKESKDVEDMDVMNKRLAEKAMNKNSSTEDNKNSNEESENDELEEPLPRGMNKYCHICNFNYENYLSHIKRFEHFENMKRYKNNINRFKNTFENIINFWENKKIENLNINKIINSEKESINNKDNTNDKKNENKNNNNNNNIIENDKTFLSKSEEISIKEKIIEENNNNSIDMNNKNIIENNETENINNISNTLKQDISNNIIKKENNNISINNSNMINETIKENISNNIKLEENPENNISSNINIHSFNLTCSTDNKTNINSIYNNNNILSMNSSNNHYLNIQNKKNINKGNNNIISKIRENLNIPKKNINPEKKDKDFIKPQKMFITNSIPLFSTLSNYQLINSKKRKREEPEKTMEIFVVSTPKRIKYDRFPLLSRDNPKKLINNSILFFK